MDAERMAAVVEALQGKHSLLVAAHAGSAELVAEHIGKGADLAARDGRGRTALLLACAHGREEPARMLVAPTQAAGALDAVGDNGVSSLMAASENGDAGIVAALLAAGAKPELADTRGRTALALACVKVGSMEGLSGGEAGAGESRDGVAEGSWVKVTSTFRAEKAKQVPKGLLGKVKEIDDKYGHANIEFEGIGGQWVLKGSFGNLAVLSQADVLQERATREEAVALLIAPMQAAGALDAADDEGNTALLHACLHGVCSVAEQLLAAGANPDLVNKSGETAFMLAKDARTIESMLAAGVQAPDFRGQEDIYLRSFATSGYVPYVEALLKAGADPASTDEAGRNSLMLALEQGHEAAAEVLLAPTSAAGAIDARGGEFEGSALIEASAAGLKNMVEKLLALGAKPELAEKNGSNSLMWALCRKHEATAELLLEPTIAAGALDAQGGSDQSALMWASASGLAGMVEKLLELGAKPDLKDAGGKTALDLANSAGHTACVAVLEQHAM